AVYPRRGLPRLFLCEEKKERGASSKEREERQEPSSSLLPDYCFLPPDKLQGSSTQEAIMTLDRRRLIASLTTGLAWSATGAVPRRLCAAPQAPNAAAPPLRRPDGTVDWNAVRALFPLAKDKLHFSSFLFVSHPAPVAAAIEGFRRKLDADPTWIEDVAFEPGSEERPFQQVKKALAGCPGGLPGERRTTPDTHSA